MVQTIIKFVATVFGLVTVFLLYFNTITVPGGYSGLSDFPVRVAGMLLPLVVLLLVMTGIVTLCWSVAYARLIFFAGAILQVFVILGMYTFIWHDATVPVTELISGKGAFLGLPVIILLGMALLLYMVQRNDRSYPK